MRSIFFLEFTTVKWLCKIIQVKVKLCNKEEVGLHCSNHGIISLLISYVLSYTYENRIIHVSDTKEMT